MEALAIGWLAILALAVAGSIAFAWRRNPKTTRFAAKHALIGMGVGVVFVLIVYTTITALSVLFLGLKP